MIAKPRKSRLEIPLTPSQIRSLRSTLPAVRPLLRLLRQDWQSVTIQRIRNDPKRF